MRKISGSYHIGIYVRESRDDNEENYETIETQKEILLKYSQENMPDSRVERIYIDDNVSGSGFERKGINELKKDVLNRTIDLLLLKDLSRLGRNNAKTLLFLDFLEENGVRVITYDNRYDSTRDNDTVGIDTWFNERYVRDISRKIRANLRHKIEKGEYIGHAPYGYEKSPEQKNRLVVKSDEAAVVRKIYQLYKEGYGYNYIARHLNSKGIESPSKGLWNPVGVRRILCSRVYTGDTVQGISERISFKSKKTRRLPEDRWVITENTHEAIIEREEFENIQALRISRNKFLSPHKGVLHLFKGLLFCGNCSSTMYARKRSGRPMGYICSNYGKVGKSICTSHHIKEDDLKSIIVEDLLLLFENKEIVSRVKKLLESNMKGKDTENKLAVLEKQILAKQRQQEILYQDRLEERISESLFARMNEQLEKKLDLLKREMESLKFASSEARSGSEILARAINELKQHNLSNEILRAVVKRIIVFDKGDNFGDKVWSFGLSLEEREEINKCGGIIIEYRASL